MNLPSIIGITGGMRSGKNEVAKILQSEFGYETINYSDAIRDEVADVIRQQEMPSGIPLPLWETILLSSPKEVYDQDPSDEIRALLQWFGVHRREIDQNHWRKAVEAKIKPGKRYVVTGVRFSNECIGVMWRVTRKNRHVNGFASHVTEKYVDRLPVSIVVNNDGTLDDLRDRVVAALRMEAQAA